MSHLSDVAELALREAKKLGVDQAEVSLHQGEGTSVSVRKGELETLEKHNDSQLSVSVYQAHKTGSASSADLSEQGVRAAVKAAVSIAGYTAADPCFGLADEQLMATEFPKLDLCHPWQQPIEQFVELAQRCESSALDYDTRISNSEGASVNTYSGTSLYANTHGFLHAKPGSRHSVSCSVIGSKDDTMQRDYWYDSQRQANKLQPAEEIGKLAAQRTVQRLGARKIASCEAPVLYDATIASSLISHLVSALKGGAIYKKASFMLDKLDQAVLPDFVSISENPHRVGGLGSAAYDNEGVATQEHHDIVTEGVVKRYILGSYTARKLNLATTANAGGVRNLTVSHSGQGKPQLLREMGTGLLVTELIGSGINMVTGDYSRGAAGFWVENGEIQYPVEEITIAGNLLDMFRNIEAIGADTHEHGNTHVGSILIGKLTIAGS